MKICLCLETILVYKQTPRRVVILSLWHVVLYLKKSLKIFVSSISTFCHKTCLPLGQKERTYITKFPKSISCQFVYNKKKSPTIGHKRFKFTKRFYSFLPTKEKNNFSMISILWGGGESIYKRISLKTNKLFFSNKLNVQQDFRMLFFIEKWWKNSCLVFFFLLIF